MIANALKRGPGRWLGPVFALIGPGFMTAAVVLGPGSITVSSKAGALFGYSLLWTVLAAGAMMVVFTSMGARIGMALDRSFLTAVAEQNDRWIAVLIGFSGFLICAGFQTGNNLGVGMAMQALLGGSVGVWAGAFSSFVMNALIGGALLADGLGRGGSLDSRWSKGLASGVMVLGTVVALFAGENPVELIVLAQGTTILGVPLIAYVMILLANDARSMGDLRNRWASNAVCVVALLWLLFLSGSQFLRLFGA